STRLAEHRPGRGAGAAYLGPRHHTGLSKGSCMKNDTEAVGTILAQLDELRAEKAGLEAIVAGQAGEIERQARGVPVTWLLTPQQVMALAEELIAGSQTMGGADDDGIESDVRLMVRLPGTVADDDGKLNETP